MKTQAILINLFFLFFTSQLFSQATDPHRGLTVTKFLNLTPASINNGYPRVAVSFTILGTPKEDSLLEYAMQNHITYLELYDVYRAFRYNDSPGTLLSSGETLLNGLCLFIQKAKNNYCISEIGVASEEAWVFQDAYAFDTAFSSPTPPLSLTTNEQNFFPNGSALVNLLTQSFQPDDSLFRISEKAKELFRVMRLNGSCTAHIDFFNIVLEYWRNSTYQSLFVPMIQYADSLKLLYNSTHSDSIRIAIYIRAIGSTTDSQAVRLVDGDNGTRPLADRMLAVHYGISPTDQYTIAGWKSQMQLFKQPNTRNKTDYHPYFSTETKIMNRDYMDYLGVWLRDRYRNNIFEAETDFYRRWRSDSLTDILSVHENDIRPGSFHYFASAFMLDSLKRPRIFYTNSPICTGGASSDSLHIYYMGPREAGIQYTLQIDSAGTILSFSGSTGAADSLLNNISFPAVKLGSAASPYPVTLTLNYSSGCSYSYTDTVLMRNTPTIQAMGATTFCEGQKVTLRSNRTGQFSWRKTGSNQVLSTSQDYLAEASGTYYCIVGGGNCAGTSNQIVVIVHSNPLIKIYTDCINDTTALLSVIPAGLTGSSYQWSTNETSSTITTSVPGINDYFVNVITNEGCIQQAVSRFILPAHVPNPSIIIEPDSGKEVFCRGDQSFDSLILSPTDYHFGSIYNWYVNGHFIQTYGKLRLTPPPDSTALINLIQTSATGCSNLGYDTILISVFHCCDSQDSTTFFSDSSSNYSSGFTNTTVNVLGDFYIDTNFVINGSHLLMDSTSHIYVLPGKTLTINNSDLKACHRMWNGIFMMDSTANLILNGDTIEDAFFAIQDTTGAKITVSNCMFNKNRRGIYIFGTSLSMLSTISSCTFTSQDNSGSMAPTGDNESAYSGIEVKNMNGWTLGGTNNSLSFRHLYYGIKAESSSLTISNCDFQNMRRYSFHYDNLRTSYAQWGYDGYGVYSKNATTTNKAIQVHSSNFKNCGIGIAFYNNINSSIDSCTIDSSRIASILIHNPAAATVSILKNTISNFFNGISMFEPRLANSISLDGNIFDTPSNLNASPFAFEAVNWAVKLQNRLPGRTNASIKQNRMKHQRKGIYLNGCDHVDILENNIELLDTNYTGKMYGIWAVNSDTTSILNDSIYSIQANQTPSSMRGIRFESSLNCQIKNNYLLNMGTAINGLHTCDTTVLCGNDMWNCMRGMDFYDIHIASQGGAGMPNDNIWRNIALSNRTVGTRNAVTFYHRYLQSDTLNKFSPGTNFIVQCFENTTGNSPCDVVDTFPQIFSDFTESVIKDSIVFPFYNEENKWVAQAYAFHLLSADSMLMHQGLPSDYQRQQFFNELEGRNIGMFEEISNAFKDENYLQAITDLLNVQPENLIEENLTKVYSRLEKVLSFGSITKDDTLSMDSIAVQLAIAGGPGVYMARAILDLEYDDELIGSLLRESQPLVDELFTKTIIYPNPTVGQITIEKDLSPYTNCNLSIFDLNGRVLIQSELSISQKVFEKEINLLQTGMYVIQIYCDNQIIESIKLIVEK